MTHPACLEHEPHPRHPERPDRLRAILAAVNEDDFPDLAVLTAPSASREALERAHAKAHVEAILDTLNAETARSGHVSIDADTAMSAGSAEAALKAAGALCLAVDEVMSGKVHNAFCAVRPPGHHAERDRAMGFCLFNNVAVAAYHAREAYGIKRIAIVDFDVHHGNGTQDIFWDDPDALYISTHQMPLYPGSGDSSERGVADNILNLPLPPGANGSQFRSIFDARVIPALEAFQPEFLFISAGFDAHADDPLANLRLTEDDFAWATRRLCAFAEHACGGRVVSALEGGYDLDALARSAAAHMRALREF
ncbi:MAG TPA: histone deacetylase family protein [Rhizomicrobium sp.]|nr:histone deacetylase family protein [Rhizomicrobium sp.]